MTRSEFRERLEKQVLVLDGATGTELQRLGMPQGVCPEKWVLGNPEVLREVQQAYIDAGAQGIYSCTFGANRVKLEEFGLHEDVHELNRDLVRLSRAVAGDEVLAAGDMSPTGRFVEPFGDLAFDDAVEIYREQVVGLLEGGADFFMVETMVDIQEARAAVLAVREECDLPVCVSLTFDESGRTLTGTDPQTAVIILQHLGADAVGCNCSTGPRPMRRVLETMAKVAHIPLLALPNAGIPRLVRNETVFSLSAEDFVAETAPIAQTASMIGGCCGTSPEYIRVLAEAVETMPVPAIPDQHPSALSSARQTVFLDAGQPVLVVGERINPTGKEALKAELREGKTGEVRRLALEQGKAGADLLDVNVGASGVDEGAAMIEAIDCLCTVSDLPLCIDSSDPAVIERALRMYPGRALVNSISGEAGKADALLPIVARYGAMFIALPVGDDGIPASAEERAKIIQKLHERARAESLDKDSMVVDGLVMTVSSDQTAAAETLRLVDWTANTFGAASLVGLSNVSFGLPERQWINAGFLAMATHQGLRMMIANPSDEVLMNTKLAGDVLTNRDPGARRYAEHFAPSASAESATDQADIAGTALEPVHEAVLEGDRENIVTEINEALDA
ncbi:MAG: homocysteine S-methyltransferase family protein, partial [Verrucomicrobiota bacterium]